MSKKKKPFAPRVIVSEVDPSLLLDSRRVLFSKGVSFQQFLGFVLERMSVRDERVMSLVDEAHLWKNKQKGVDKIDDYDHLYSVLEERFSERRKEIREGEHHDQEDAQETNQAWSEDGWGGTQD